MFNTADFDVRVTPRLIPTGSGKGAVARFIADGLKDAGDEIEIVGVEPGRPNHHPNVSVAVSQR